MICGIHWLKLCVVWKTRRAFAFLSLGSVEKGKEVAKVEVDRDVGRPLTERDAK